MAAAPGAPGPAPLPSGRSGPGSGGARNSAPSPGLLNPSQQLSGPALSRAAQDIANAQTQGPISELAKQLAMLNGQGSAAQSQTFGYYMQLAKEARDAVNQEKGLSTGLNTQLGQLGQDTTTQLGQIGQQAQGGALGRLSALGLGGDQQAQLQGETARQQGLGALNSGVFQSAGATQGANYTGNAISNLGTFALRGQERLGNIAQATRLSEEPITAKIAALQEKNGALYGTALGQLRAQERNYQVAQEGLGIKQQTLQNTVANDRTRNALTQRGQNITQQNDLASQALHASQLAQKTGYDNQSLALKQAALNLKSGKGGTKPLTTAQQNTLYRNLNEMTQLIGLGQKAGHSEQQIRQALQLGQIQKGFPAQSAVLVQAAYELLGWGHLTPQTANAMRGMGLRGGTFRGKPIGVAPAPPNPGILGLGAGLNGIAQGIASVGNAVGG